MTRRADDHAQCAGFLRDRMAEQGADVTVSEAQPIVPSGYEEAAFRCPHGVTLWMEPTSEQRAAWARDGVL